MKRLSALLLLIARLALHRRGGGGGDGPDPPSDGPTRRSDGPAGRPAPAKDVKDGQTETGKAADRGMPRAGRRRASRQRDPEVPKPARSPRRDPDGPMPAHYRQVAYGQTPESQLAQAARLRDGNRDNLYGGATFRDSQNNTYQVDGRADATKHAEGDILKQMRQKIAEQQGIRPDQVDLRAELRDVRLYVEFSPCPTGNRCQDMLDQYLPPGSEIQYSWPWQPRSEQDSSRQSLADAVNDLFTRKRPGTS
ncbi:nucleic acid/nucleotide deaminase domain-containing protein [Saccharothrix variisporea]|uniref:Nucleic acid/nucleotide deaminase of polymorphic system toxin n=1 Tax=Saccharothrix variisporea TaxID=543527 RepID=A0A495XST2_9PSEU|nr:nucleic acid/nucleotide deaminase domain-containing protein [Saccharothrix variisporea]RKT74718.1 nucleic acid/nucleotide deaminase of polymorphic system toxin [Saccharothrix variisporea]